MDSSSLVSQVYKARTSLLEQLQAQGYDISQIEGFTVTEVNAMLRHDQLDFTVSMPADSLEQKKTHVKFYLAKALRPANVDEFVSQLFKVEELLTKADTLYIVTMSDANETLLKKLNLIWQRDRILVNIYAIQRLQANILRHVKVPKHTVLTTEEAKDVRQRYNLVKDEQIPSISRFDPVSVALGIRPGQLCKIDRYSPTAGTAVYYRLCIA
jgi:DNA-directed RNA polymerase subunit H (RpoH/RPB5)